MAFGEEVLGETYTDEVKEMMESVRDNIVTVAKSANATGKTHGAARVAVWWFKCFADSQVYTAAAPPESNLKKLLWGEIGSITEKHPELFKTEEKTSLTHSAISTILFKRGNDPRQWHVSATRGKVFTASMHPTCFLSSTRGMPCQTRCTKASNLV